MSVRRRALLITSMAAVALVSALIVTARGHSEVQSKGGTQQTVRYPRGATLKAATDSSPPISGEKAYQ